jgi:hypothetical protein
MDRLASVLFVPLRNPSNLNQAEIRQIQSVVRSVSGTSPPQPRQGLPQACP